MKNSFTFVILLLLLGFGGFMYVYGYLSNKEIAVGNVLSVSDTNPSTTPTTTPTPIK